MRVFHAVDAKGNFVNNQTDTELYTEISYTDVMDIKNERYKFIDGRMQEACVVNVVTGFIEDYKVIDVNDADRIYMPIPTHLDPIYEEAFVYHDGRLIVSLPMGRTIKLRRLLARKEEEMKDLFASFSISIYEETKFLSKEDKDYIDSELARYHEKMQSFVKQIEVCEDFGTIKKLRW